MEKTFPNLAKEIDMEVQAAQKVPNTTDAKRPTPRHTIIKGQRLKIKRDSQKQQEKRS